MVTPPQTTHLLTPSPGVRSALQATPALDARRGSVWRSHRLRGHPEQERKMLGTWALSSGSPKFPAPASLGGMGHGGDTGLGAAAGVPEGEEGGRAAGRASLHRGEWVGRGLGGGELGWSRRGRGCSPGSQGLLSPQPCLPGHISSPARGHRDQARTPALTTAPWGGGRL